MSAAETPSPTLLIFSDSHKHVTGKVHFDQKKIMFVLSFDIGALVPQTRYFYPTLKSLLRFARVDGVFSMLQICNMNLDDDERGHVGDEVLMRMPGWEEYVLGSVAPTEDEVMEMRKSRAFRENAKMVVDSMAPLLKLFAPGKSFGPTQNQTD